MKPHVAAPILAAALAALLATAQNNTPAVFQLPGVSSADCHPAGEKPWTNTSQTPVCRALEALAPMTYDEKLNFRGALPRLGLYSGPGGRGGQAPPARTTGITVFPHEHVLAATWDKSLAARAGKAIGEEFAGRGTAFPMINLTRTWHWGRTADTFGEDPYLTAEMVVSEVTAIQSEGVVAILKHYAANNQEIDRQTVDERIPERALHELYLYAWKQAVERARVAGVFCAYNAVNGGQITTSTSLTTRSSAFSALTRASASAAVLYIFQLPAIIGLRLGFMGERPYLSDNTATPGSALPSRNSSDAPPPVETNVTCLS